MLKFIAYLIPAMLSVAFLGLSFISVFFLPFVASPTAHTCPAIWADVSFQGSSFAAGVGPPLYSWPQFVLKPGSTANLIVTYHSSNNLRIIFDPHTGNLPSYIYWGTIGNNATRAWNETGVQISLSSIMYQDNSTARLTYEVNSSSSSLQGTHMLSWASTCYGSNNSPWILLTLGSRTYDGLLPFDQGPEKISFPTAVARELVLSVVPRQFLALGMLTLLALPAIWILDFLYKGFTILHK